MPAAMMPPRYSALAEIASKVMAVPRSTMTQGPPYLCSAATLFTIRSAPDFRRIFVADGQAGIGLGRHEHGFGAEIAVRHLRQRAVQRRNDGRNDDAVNERRDRARHSAAG